MSFARGLILAQDASLVVLAENLGHGRILTSDCNDFSTYRWNQTRFFNNLFLEYP